MKASIQHNYCTGIIPWMSNLIYILVSHHIFLHILVSECLSLCDHPLCYLTTLSNNFLLYLSLVLLFIIAVPSVNVIPSRGGVNTVAFLAFFLRTVV